MTMEKKYVYTFRLDTAIELDAGNIEDAHRELFVGLNKIHEDFGIQDFRVRLVKICENSGIAIFSSTVDFEDSDFDISNNFFN